MFQSRICDNFSPAISLNKLFHMLFKNLSLLACKRKLQDFSLSQKNCLIPQIHFVSHGFSPTKPKTHAIWVRKDLLRLLLFICPCYNSFNYLWTFFNFCFRLFCFKKIQKNENFQKDKSILLCLVLFFLRIT